jgi:hypothetical protein
MLPEGLLVAPLELRQAFVKILHKIGHVAHWMLEAKAVYTPPARARFTNHKLRVALSLPDDAGARTIWGNNVRITPPSWLIATRISNCAEDEPVKLRPL